MPGNLTVDELLTAIRSADADVRAAAWLRGGEVGPPALVPLAEVAGAR